MCIRIHTSTFKFSEEFRLFIREWSIWIKWRISMGCLYTCKMPQQKHTGNMLIYFISVNSFVFDPILVLFFKFIPPIPKIRISNECFVWTIWYTLNAYRFSFGVFSKNSTCHMFRVWHSITSVKDHLKICLSVDWPTFSDWLVIAVCKIIQAWNVLLFCVVN